jgi:mitogen-activated protein kinase 1/3
MRNSGAGIDVWSAGCVVAEMLLGRRLLPGQSNVNMLTLLGSPSLNDVWQITNVSARTFLDSLPRCAKKDFRKVFDGCNSLAVDFVERMLTWNPETRVSVDDALAHPFMSRLHDLFGEPVTVPLRLYP